MARSTMLIGIVMVTAASAGVTTIAFGPNPDATLFAAGQSAYLMGTATLLVFGRDRLTVIALVPGLSVAAASLAVADIPGVVVLAATAATPVFIVVAALVATHNERKAPRPHIGRRDWSVAVGYSVLGLTWALVIGLAAMAAIDSVSVLVTVSVAASGMVLTMGVAEWQLLRVRQRSRILMVDMNDGAVFATKVRWVFTRALAVIAASLVVSSSAVAGVASLAGVLSEVSVVLAVGFGFLGLAFFAGLSLVSMGNMVLPIVGSLAVILEVGALLVLTSLGPVPSAGIYSTGCILLFAVLTVAALREVGDPVVHR